MSEHRSGHVDGGALGRPRYRGVVAELVAAGVTFESYDEPVKTDDKGIHDSGYGKVAWFKDPDGNTFALEQV